MKKGILGLVVLVGLFMVWKFTLSTEVVEPLTMVSKEVQAKEEVFFTVDEFVEEPSENVLKKELLVDIGVDVNITKEHNVTLHVNLNESNTSYSYVWKEREIIVGLGEVLTKVYGKGEHLVKVEVLEDGEVIGEDEVLITAWDYLKVEKMYRNEEGGFQVFEKRVYDHHDWLLLLEHPLSNKTTYIYNDGGKVLEEKYEFYYDSNQSYTLLYTYDDENNMLSMERLDVDDNVLSSVIYDESGKRIVLTEEEKQVFSSPEEYIDNSRKTYNKEGKVVRREIDTLTYGTVVETMKYDGDKLVYKERFMGDNQYITEYAYNEEGRGTLRKSTKKDKDGTIIWENSNETKYSKDGKMLRQERKNRYRDELNTHFIQSWTYKDNKLLENETVALVGVCPCSADIIKEKTVYIYDDKGELLRKQYQVQKEGEEELQKKKTSMKVVRTYTNTL